MSSFIRNLAAVAAFSTLLVACSSPGASESPSTPPSAPPSAEPSAPVSPDPTSPPPASPRPTDPPAQGHSLDVDGYARVVTNDLRVRSKPGVSADSHKLEPLLDDGALVLVLDGPVAASGFDWYLIKPITQFEEPELPLGWAAVAGKDGERWMARERVECPPVPASVDDLAALNETDRMHFEISCYGGEEITFRARLGSPEAMCGIEVPWGTLPEWFDRCSQPGYFLVPPDAPYDRATIFPTWYPGLDLSMAPDPQSAASTWPVVEVTVQFDHPEARTCRGVQNYDEPGVGEPAPEWFVLDCRLQFVVTSIDEVG
ncbi:MAG TPA: hypothetical protein VLA44_09670 [Clostridia bacterium]|nr:hypothetical protein [Clostridia bacterium]